MTPQSSLYPRLTLALMIACGSSLARADAPATQPSDDISFALADAPAANASSSPMIAPPLQGAGVRGDRGRPHPVPIVWVPESRGLTLKEQPTLIWSLNRPLDVPTRLRIIMPEAPDLDLWTSAGPVPAGIHRLDTTGSPLHLVVGQDYQWSVTAVFDEVNNDKNLVSTGAIRRIDANDPNAVHGVFYDIIARRVERLAQFNADASSDAAAKALASVNLLLTQVSIPNPQNPRVIDDKPNATTQP